MRSSQLRKVKVVSLARGRGILKTLTPAHLKNKVLPEKEKELLTEERATHVASRGTDDEKLLPAGTSLDALLNLPSHSEKSPPA